MIERPTMGKFSVAGAAAYERGIGRWSRRLAPAFLDFCGPVAGRVLDIGCGTGILTESLLARGSVTGVVGIDVAEPLLARARGVIADPRATFDHVDAAALPYAGESFDHALSMLVVNFLEDRSASLREAMRVTRAGGTVAAAVWDMRGGFMYARFAWDIAAALDPVAATERDKLFKTRFLRPGSLEALWTELGLIEVHGQSLAIDMTFSDFDDYWQPLLGTGQTFGKYFGALPAAARLRTCEAVRAAFLVADDDGPRSFAARAFVVSGRVPGSH
jgi:SAM-dependent methyltransferase